MEEWVVRNRSSTQAVKQSATQSWQHRFEYCDLFAPSHIDMHVQPSVEVEADRRILRSDDAQHAQDAIEFVGHGGGMLQRKVFDGCRCSACNHGHGSPLLATLTQR